MKIAMIGSWNSDSGAAVHAEFIGREWVKKGVDLKVFTFYRDSFHGTALTKSVQEEEDYITRCFTVYGIPDAKMDTKPILAADFDIFVAEDLGMIPMKDLLAVFPEIKKKAKTVNIIHDGELSDKPEFFKFDWDHVVCFDDRYYDFLKKAYPEEKLSIIPYPSYPLEPGDKMKTREELGLPLDKKIVLLFGQAARSSVNTTVVLNHLSEKYDIQLLLVTEGETVLEAFEAIRSKISFDLNIVKKSPDMELLYKYLHASDCMMYNKHSMGIAVVGSTVFQCMGAGCPIVALESNFVYPFHKEVIKYRNYYELEDCLIDVFEEGPRYREQQASIREYLSRYSAGPTAEKFLELFRELSENKKL